MDVRNGEKYTVNHANTERLKNSSIPYMQRMLNFDHELQLRKKRNPG